MAGGTTAAAKAGGEPGAKDLFFGDDNPALASAQSLRPSASAAAQRTPAPATKTTNAGIRVWLTEASDTTGSRKISPQQVFRTGDRFRFWLQSNRDGYLYLLNVGTSGTTRLMFPRANQDNRIVRRTDFSIASPIVFSEPAGAEQLVVVLSSKPIDDAAVQLKDGSLVKVALKPGATATKPAQGRDSASASLDLALADLRGSKDLKFDDDGSELVAVNRRGDDKPGAFTPVVVNLRLTHR
jgi:hypothetical protein